MMIDRGGNSPRRYFVDKGGGRVLFGLTVEETFEFEALDGVPALDDSDGHIALDASGMSTTTREERWLGLYTRHEAAWRA
jgi:hypothetical protein